MKEYKVVTPKLGLTKRHEKLQDLLNQYAREGWTLNYIGAGFATMILERDKIR